MECVVNNTKVDYEIRGEGKPIVILHTSMLYDIEPVFKEKDGWKRIYINYPGIGCTEVKDWMYSSDDVLDVIDDSIDAILGRDKFLLIGFSYSAYIARGVMKKRQGQVDGIAMICPVIYAENSRRDVPDRVAFKDDRFISCLTEEEVEELNPYIVQDGYIWEKLQKAKKQDNIAFNMDFYNKLKQTGRYEYSFDVDNLTHPFDKPSLIIMGRQDNIAGYKDAWRIIENFPRAAFSILDMSGHYIFMEQQHMVRELISEWLDRVEKSSYRFEVNNKL